MRRYLPFALAVIPLLVGIYALFFSAAPPARAGTETPTATATVGPAIVMIPEGNENNRTDTQPAAANLWLCVTGECAGPGEGNLIVFEYATGVTTGDFNGDAVEDGLGACRVGEWWRGAGLRRPVRVGSHP